MPTEPTPPNGAPPAGSRSRNRVWRGVKWPLRKLLLGAYLAGEAIHSRQREALAIGVLLLALLVTGGVFAATRPAPAPANVEQTALPSLPASVRHYLHARQRFDAAEAWAAFDATGQSALKTTEPQLRAAFDQQKKAGFTITRYVYSGGYRTPDGASHYTIEVYATEQGHASVSTWYFAMGSDGLIMRELDLTPG